ncbi:hypothetical protein JAN5088_00046 [Jannaschia rubra]|uniref:Uncharacterized protein n=1 Tax=Jannaschia rubra TaxID=282197 RepID=A0A0M6XKU5_9RHOB|nr:hypothetical protein JAN5088_00046 [Jannaschia rubra]
MLALRDLLAGAAHDLRVQLLAAPVGPGGLEGGVFVALARGPLQLAQGLVGGDHRLAAAFPDGGDHQIHHRAALLVEIEATGEDRALPAPAFRPGLRLVVELAVPGIGRVVEIPRLAHPVRGDDADGLEGDRRALALPGPGLGLVDPEGGQVVAVGPVLELGPGQAVPRHGAFPDPRPAGLVVPLSMEGGPAQLGDGGDLVDADGGLEHGVSIRCRQGIAI